MSTQSRLAITNVVVTLPHRPQMMPVQSHHWAGPGSGPSYPAPYWGPQETKNFDGCHGAIVEGGALEIRRYDGESFDYDVVHGFGPNGWASFDNVEAEGDDS